MLECCRPHVFFVVVSLAVSIDPELLSSASISLVQTRASLLQKDDGEILSGETDDKSDSAMPIGSRLGDLVIPNTFPPRVNSVSFDGDARLTEIAAGSLDSAFPAFAHVEPAFGKQLVDSTRVMLMGLIEPFHGSTALEGMLMSSNKLATLCSGRSYQCEGGKLDELVDHDAENASIKTAIHCDKWKYDEVLSTFSKYWDLARPVLFDKTPFLVHYAADVHKGMTAAQIPSALASIGVTKLKFAYIIMYRPTCLWQISSHAIEFIEEHGDTKHAEKEVGYFKEMMEAHQYLSSLGVPILVINLGDLLWMPKKTAERLEAFLPYLGKLKTDYLPILGRDVLVENQWKANGSVAAFAASIDPQQLGYHVQQGECTEESSLFSMRGTGNLETPRERVRGRNAEVYLQSFARGASRVPGLAENDDAEPTDATLEGGQATLRRRRRRHMLGFRRRR